MDRVEINKKIIIDFLKVDNKGYSVGDLVRHLMDDLLYVSQVSARVSIGNLIKRMEDENIVSFKEIKRGHLSIKVWYLK